MAKQRSSRRTPGSAALAVRIVAFLIAVLGILAIPAAVVATTTGGMAARTALFAVAIAAVLIAAATLAARRVDPLRS